MRNEMRQYLADGEALAGYNADPTGEVFANLLRLASADDEDEEDEEALEDKVTKDVEVDIEKPFKDMNDAMDNVSNASIAGELWEQTKNSAPAEHRTAAMALVIRHPALMVDTDALPDDDVPALRRLLLRG